MVHLFAGACAVVGYHGAGATNTIFSRNRTLVVEIDTYTGTLMNIREYGVQMNPVSPAGWVMWSCFGTRILFDTSTFDRQSMHPYITTIH
jgi:capsular polysaccharide biosynthesis protein